MEYKTSFIASCTLITCMHLFGIDGGFSRFQLLRKGEPVQHLFNDANVNMPDPHTNKSAIALAAYTAGARLVDQGPVCEYGASRLNLLDYLLDFNLNPSDCEEAATYLEQQAESDQSIVNEHNLEWFMDSKARMMGIIQRLKQQAGLEP